MKPPRKADPWIEHAFEAVMKIAPPPPACDRCHDAGKLDRGNGTTKPCDCAAGQAEAARRRRQRKAKP